MTNEIPRGVFGKLLPVVACANVLTSVYLASRYPRFPDSEKCGPNIDCDSISKPLICALPAFSVTGEVLI